MNTAHLLNSYLLKFAFAFLLLTACQNTAEMESLSGKDMVAEVEADAEEPETAEIADAGLNKQADYIRESSENPLEKPKRIKTAQIRIQTDSLSLLRDKIEILMHRYDAYIHSEQLQNNDWDKRRNLQIKIPVQHFENFISDLQKTGEKITFLEIKSTDVTGDYYDVQARLKNKKALKERYLSLYQKAKNISDILSIERQINDIQTGIDQLQGKLKWLQHKTTYGTLSLELYQMYKRPQNKPVNRFWRAFQNGWQVLVGFLYVLLSLWPFIFGIALLVWIWKRKRKIIKK